MSSPLIELDGVTDYVGCQTRQSTTGGGNKTASSTFLVKLVYPT
jgi:hypothetical protein